MKYLLIYFENEEFWLEIDEQLFAMRQVIVDEDLKIHISCREDCLAEGMIYIDELDGSYKEIEKDEFERKWLSALKPYYEEWFKIKQRYSIGQKIEGCGRYFYPQGMIMKGEDYVAVYKGSKKVLINETLIAQVKEYDEDNLWLVLE